MLRRENRGFDFGSHADVLQHIESSDSCCDAFVFLNSGVVGPFIPAYVPRAWHWTEAFTDRLQGNVKLVGTSIVCLPKWDQG
jgi:hypothetical protein